MGGSDSPKKKKTPRLTGVPVSSGRDPCDISFTTPLAHVRTAHTADLKVGGVLTVEVNTVINRKTLVCKKRGDPAVVGFILARGAAKVIACIDEGHEYVAEVKKVDFGFIEVALWRSA
jgi:hypothetical protein